MKVFSSLNFEKSEARWRRARGFYFYFKTAEQRKAAELHTTTLSYRNIQCGGVVWCGATLIIDDKKKTYQVQFEQKFDIFK